MNDDTGLRERKKRETARAIEVAAVELAAEHSLSAVTIEAISARADVTSRTFFNYYASKEDAVLGLSKLPRPQLPELESVAGVSVVETLLNALLELVGSFDIGTPEFQAKRRAVVFENPSLLVADFHTHGTIETDLAEQVERLLAAQGEVPAAERSARAWGAVFLVGSVARLALHTWSHETGARRPLTEHLSTAYETFLALGRSAEPRIPSLPARHS
ncbi:helix-turn-helix domain-containing protein [Herbiconiux sp. 11R-BC]|uniref:TetR/AcrR family transcriptional regulator n=1 Tax=Herbiconiux sp. 11R-BC TaxID=3111637 RepID=UPI003BFFF29F